MIKSFSAKLSLNEGEELKFFRPRSVPYVVRAAFEFEEELPVGCLEHKGILEKVTYCERVIPIVTVAKPDRRCRKSCIKG